MITKILFIYKDENSFFKSISYSKTKIDKKKRRKQRSESKNETIIILQRT